MRKKSEIDRIIEREDDRLPRSIGPSLRLTRRALLKHLGVLAAAWTMSPWRIGLPSAFGQEIAPPVAPQDLEAFDNTPAMTQTLEAYADTLIPGEQRFPGDAAIAGIVTGAGAVQGGAINMMSFAPVGLQEILPLAALSLNVYALLYALLNDVTLDPTLPTFVALDFASRTALVAGILAGNGADQPIFAGLAAISFVAYHTAGYLNTAAAIQQGHPGLAAIGFPSPDTDGKWRFADFSYQKVLAKPHPRSKRDNPA